MKLKAFIGVIFLLCIFHSKATNPIKVQEMIDPDSLLEIYASDTTASSKTKTQSTTPNTKNESVDTNIEKQAFDSLVAVKKLKSKNSIPPSTLPTTKPKPIHIDSLVLETNPFFIDLVYNGLPLNFNWNLKPDFQTLYYGEKASCLTESIYKPVKIQSPEEFIVDLRRNARNEITRKAAYLYVFSADELPDPTVNKSDFIKWEPIHNVQFVDNEDTLSSQEKRLIVKKAQLSPFQRKIIALAQFSQNSVSSNWYQGGNSNVAILGILSADLNYDDKKNTQWENHGEWRMGFNSVSGDTLRLLNTNDDVLKMTSKFGFRANGNWFYSGSVDFSTQFFNSYRGVNSTVLKTSFLAPVRFNIGIGFDYKYQKIFSLMLSPIAYKYIYVNENTHVDPNLFGIKTGRNTLKEVGSSFKACLSYVPLREIQVDSKLSFYTNYQNVEIDWETVCNFTINRFLSARISFNPRYDNTVIMAPGEHAKLQFKQLMSLGFSHKFR